MKMSTPDRPQRRGPATWSTRDILVLGVASITLGLLSAGIFYVYVITLAALPLAAFAFAGVAYLAPLFIAYLTRDPLKILVGQVVAGLAAMPIHPAGLVAVVAHVLYGVFAVIAVFIGTQYRSFTWPRWAIVGLVAGVFNLLWNGFVLGSFTLSLSANVLAGSLALASCMVVAFLVRGVAHQVARSGVLSGTGLWRE